MAIQIRRGTDAEWESNKSNIVAGEPAIAMDTERVFVGTGTGTYVELANIDFVEKAMKEVEYSNFELQSVKGDIVSFPNGAGGIPVKDLQVGIEAVQSGSGDPSPTNVRPISGWDEVNVNVRGVNQWDEGWVLGTLNTSNGSAVAVSNRIRSKSYIRVLPNTTYYIHAPYQLIVCQYTSSQSFIRTSWLNNGTLTTASNTEYIRFASNVEATTYNNDISINYPSTDHDYHAYNGQTYTIDLNGTRYGGTLDVTTGVLTVTHSIINDLHTRAWTYVGGRFRCVMVPALDTPDVISGGIEAICSHYQRITGSTSSDSAFYMNNKDYSTNKYLVIFDSRYTDANTFKASLTDVQIVYPLATPQVVQLTPTQVTTLLGQNNIWCDTGAIEELTYRISNVQ